MGDLSAERIAMVRRLLDQAPNLAVQSLEGLLVGDLSSGDAAQAIREMIQAESLDRRLRSAVFAPIELVFSAPSTLLRMSFPAHAITGLWRAMKAAEPERMAKAGDILRVSCPPPDAHVLHDEFCRSAADGLRDRATPEFQSLAVALDAEPGRCARLVKVLALAPLVRRSLPKLPEWLINTYDVHHAAMRIAFKEAAEVAEDAGFLFLEVLLSHLE